MPKQTVKDLVTAMTRDHLGPAMAAAGFRRSGRVFWRDGPEVCHVASIQMNRWGTSRSSSFGISLGVFWHRVEKILQNPSVGRMPPPEYRCTFRIYLGSLVSKPPKPEWEVTLGSDFDSIGADVLHDLQKRAIPWFEYRSDLKFVLEKRYVWRRGLQEVLCADARVVFKTFLGEREAAAADLRRFIQNGLAQDAYALARRLRIAKRHLA